MARLEALNYTIKRNSTGNGSFIYFEQKTDDLLMNSTIIKTITDGF